MLARADERDTPAYITRVLPTTKCTNPVRFQRPIYRMRVISHPVSPESSMLRLKILHSHFILVFLGWTYVSRSTSHPPAIEVTNVSIPYQSGAVLEAEYTRSALTKTNFHWYVGSSVDIESSSRCCVGMSSIRSLSYESHVRHPFAACYGHRTEGGRGTRPTHPPTP